MTDRFEHVVLDLHDTIRKGLSRQESDVSVPAPEGFGLP
jgi:hypothetical protein